MKKTILLIVNVSASVVALFFGIVWVKRLGLEYNQEGRYFDEINSVMYDIDALPAYGVLTFIFAFIGLLGWLQTWWLRNKA